jgi:hypothetical protein
MTSPIQILIYSKERILRGVADEICRGDACYYLCDDYESFLNARKRLSDRVEVRLLGDAFHRTLQEISGKYLAFSHRINVRNQSHAFWGTHLASRNSGAIPLLKHIVYFCCARKLIEQATDRIVFICDSLALIRLIGDEAGIHGRGCRVFLAHLEKLKPSWSAARLFLKGVYFLISGTLQVIYARSLKNERITDTTPGERYVLRSWVTAGSLDADGRYRDRNLGELPDFLAKQGKEVWTIPLYFSLDRSLIAQMKQMSRSGYRFILPEQYLSISDIAKTLRDGMRALFPDLGDCELDGRKLHPLVMEIHRSVSLHPSYLAYNSVRYLLERFARRRIRIDCFIYPAENNPPEKSFILAVREHYPKARLIGFQHTAWLKEQMGVFLLPEEHSYHPLPEKLVCSGRRYLDILKSAGFPPQILVPGPNLRYAAVRSMKRESSPNGDSAPRKLLVILNYDTNQNMELLDKTGQALKGLEDLRVFIKAHPTTDTQKLSGFLRDIRFPAFEWVDGTVQEWLARVDAVVMTGGSVSSMETIAAGVPLVRVSLENNFDFDCLWDDYPVSPPASSPEKIRRHLVQALQASTEERMQLIRYGKEMVENYFEPVTPETLQVFL